MFFYILNQNGEIDLYKHYVLKRYCIEIILNLFNGLEYITYYCVIFFCINLMQIHISII